MTKTLSILAFQKFSGLSDAAIYWLIKLNRLPLTYDPTKGLEVIIDKVDLKDLIRTLGERKVSAIKLDEGLLKERLFKLLAENLDEITSEALKLINPH